MENDAAAKEVFHFQFSINSPLIHVLPVYDSICLHTATVFIRSFFNITNFYPFWTKKAGTFSLFFRLYR